MRHFKKICVLKAVVALLPLSVLQAQSLTEVRTAFPGEYAVMLNKNCDLKISIKDGQPTAETKESVEVLALDDKANGIYNKYKIYHSSLNQLKDLEAYTKMPDGNKLKKIKVNEIKTQDSRDNSVFYDDVKETVFDFPALQAGAVGTVSYSQLYKDPHFIIPFYVDSYMPVVNAKYTVTCPSDMQLKYILRNNDNNHITVNEERKGRQTIYTFTSGNNKLKDYFHDAPSRSYYEPHVIIHIASYTNDKGEQIKYLGDVDDLYKWNYSFIEKVNTQPSEALKVLCDSITEGATTESEKAYKIYNWVQEHIKYVAFENGMEGFIPRQAAEVCTKRYGDCKDMSSLLTALLKLAGLKAYFTWIGTRHIPYMYTEVPLPITDNHMISTVNIGKEWLFLDGTDPNCIFGIPSEAIQGKQALVAINDKEYKLLTVPVLAAEKNMVIDSTFISITDKGIKGNSSVYFKGYFGIDAFNSLLYRNSNDIKDYIKGRLAKGTNKFILDTYDVNKVSQSEKIINLKTKFEVPDYGKKIVDEYYINMNLDHFYNTSLIDTSKRKVAVDNTFKFYVKNYTILEIPAGFSVGYMPENFNIKNDLFSFALKYSLYDNKIIASQEFKSDCILLEPKEFNKWNETMKEMTNQYKKQLVLKKK